MMFSKVVRWGKCVFEQGLRPMSSNCSDTMDLKNGKALVTGAAEGIGRAIAKSLCKRGAKVLLSDVNETTGKKTRDELAEEFGSNSVTFTVCDVRQLDQFKDALKLADKTFCGLNILVNNAGIIKDKDVDSANLISINVRSVVGGTRLGMKLMSKQNGGSGGAVLNLSSITALYDPWPSVPSYSSSRAFVQKFTVCLGDAIYYEPSGVRVMSICPGITSTPLGDGLATLHEDAPHIQKSLAKELKTYPWQKAESVGEAAAKVLERGTSGTTWLIEGDLPVQRVHMKVVKEDCFL